MLHYGGRTMREKLAKFLVADNVFDLISKYGNTTVPYVMAEGFDNDIGRMDFIIFYNANHEEQLRLYWTSDERKNIEYTSSFLSNSGNISRNALCTILYETIMWLRHRAYIENGILKYLKTFPIKQIVQHLQILDCCLELFENIITTDTFIAKLKKLVDDDFYFDSTEILFKEYGWNDTMVRSVDKDILMKIQKEVDAMKTYLNDRQKWHLIWSSAYKIHNEPEKLAGMKEKNC